MSEQIADYDYEYPEELVAQDPLSDRGASRMMVLSASDRQIRHTRFADLPQFLAEGDLLVANDTSVLASRFFAKKSTGGTVEILLLRPLGGGEWSVLLSPTRGLAEGSQLSIFSREAEETTPLKITVTSLRQDAFQLRFDSLEAEQLVLSKYGEMPLPPYIKRPLPKDQDRRRYQTVFASNPGAAAAPTAGLHFTEAMQHTLRDRGIVWATLTLHVGPGTFLPVRTERLDDHPMHAEFYRIPAETREALQACRARGGKVVAVGTTTLRALEAYGLEGKFEGWTNLFIKPGFQFRAVNGLLTNFHQPRSTLLVLVSALAGRDFIFRSYQEAVRERYRLFSYGDCMLIRGK
jgi:S-adenosylmethionine:tRNA ribosyltransferase-isomerase